MTAVPTVVTTTFWTMDRVADAKLRVPSPGYDSAALNTARQWKFRAAKPGGGSGETSMKRRAFLSLLGGAAASPFALSAAAAQSQTLPVIGFLHSASLEPNAKRLDGFKRGLQSAGFIEGKNVTIEYRWAGGQNAKLPELAAELVNKPVSIIATLSSTFSATPG